MQEYMIGTHKFECNDEAEALRVAKRTMFERGWRNLRLMRRETDGWNVCQVIPSFNTNR